MSNRSIILPEQKLADFSGRIMRSSDEPKVLRECSRCLYDESFPMITFDEEGMCSYCQLHDEMELQYPQGEEGGKALQKMVDDIRKEGKGKKYDCIMGVSGGCDSSYLLYQLVEMGLRPLAVHFDNTWNSPIATQNIYNVLNALNVDLYTCVANNREYDDIYRSFMLSGVKDLEAPTDLAITTVLYQAGAKHGIKYLINGHSFRTEGISPLGWLYMDGKYVHSIHKQFGRVPMKTYPLLTLTKFLRHAVFNNFKIARPLYYMSYPKEEAKKILSDHFGWQWYGGHHLENRFTAFFHSYFMPRKTGADTRWLGHSALIRSGQLTKDAAKTQLSVPQECPEEIIELVKKRLEFSDAEFDRIMTAPLRHYSEFPTYKKTFERLRPLFCLLYKMERVTKSFYIKFCFPDSSGQKNNNGAI